MPKSKAESCGNCIYGKPLQERIICRRFPPTCDGAGAKTHDHQPLMYGDDWCGEHKFTNPNK